MARRAAGSAPPPAAETSPPPAGPALLHCPGAEPACGGSRLAPQAPPPRPRGPAPSAPPLRGAPASRLGLAPSVRGVPARPGHLSRSRFRSHSRRASGTRYVALARPVPGHCQVALGLPQKEIKEEALLGEVVVGKSHALVDRGKPHH